MKEHGEEWAEILHAQILREQTWITLYPVTAAWYNSCTSLFPSSCD